MTCHIANPSAKFNRAEYLNTVKPGFSGHIPYNNRDVIKFLMFKASKFLYKAIETGTGIPWFTLLMWGHIKNAESKNCANQDYLVVLKGIKIGQNDKPRSIENHGCGNLGNQGMPV